MDTEATRFALVALSTLWRRSPFYSIRSERQLMERLEFDLLFRWFVGARGIIRVLEESLIEPRADRPAISSVATRASMPPTL